MEFSSSDPSSVGFEVRDVSPLPFPLFPFSVPVVPMFPLSFPLFIPGFPCSQSGRSEDVIGGLARMWGVGYSNKGKVSPAVSF